MNSCKLLSFWLLTFFRERNLRGWRENLKHKISTKEDTWATALTVAAHIQGPPIKAPKQLIRHKSTISQWTPAPLALVRSIMRSLKLIVCTPPIMSREKHIIYHNDELSLTMTWVGCFVNKRFRAYLQKLAKYFSKFLLSPFSLLSLIW